MLRAWLKRRFPSLLDIDDIVQECYARVWAARCANSINSPKAFLFTTARNLATDRIRRGKVVKIDSLAEMDKLTVQDEGPSAPETAALHQELELLTLALQSLPGRCRQVLTLRKIYGLSQKEIAARLQISESTVEAQVANGMHRCGKFLATYGLP